MEQQDKDYAKKLVERFEAKKAIRINWENNWQETYDYTIPRKNDVTKTSLQGEKKGNEEYLFDTTAINATERLAGSLHTMLTNSVVRFFDYTTGDESLDNDEEVKEYLQTVGDRSFAILNESNFQTEVHEFYMDLASIGTACMYMGDHPEAVLHFSTRAMKEIYVAENNLGVIDCVDRLFKWTPRQIVQEFGEENLPDEVLQLYRNNHTDPLEILHCVYPSDEDKEKKKIFPYKSVYILKDKNLILSRGGFREMPYAVSRWTKTSGELYGRGPGMNMLPDIKMVNKMMETTLDGAMLTVRPPMLLPDDGVIGRIKLVPGGATVYRPGAENKPEPMITGARIDFGYQVLEDTRKRIRAGFYADALAMQDGPQKTATEVNQIAEEQSRTMGPVLGRQHHEFLKTLMERVYGAGERAGKFPEPPQILQGRNISVKYQSMIARVQRMNEGQSVIRAMSVSAPVFQMYPNTVQNIDGDKAIRYIMGIYGVPQRIMRKTEEIKKIREQEAQKMAEQEQMAQAQQQAEVANKVLPGVAQLQQAAKQ